MECVNLLTFITWERAWNYLIQDRSSLKKDIPLLPLKEPERAMRGKRAFLQMPPDHNTKSLPLGLFRSARAD